MIVDGFVSVNGRTVTELGAKADPDVDHIKVRGRLISRSPGESKRKYFLVNKLRGFVSSASDPQNRPLVAHLLPPSARRGLHPVGRLDFNTEGLIILTDDGELTRLLTQAGTVSKVYHAKVKGAPGDQQIERLRRGVRLGDRMTAPLQIRLLERTREANNCWYEVTLREGRNQQIRRMFDLIGHSVIKLRRVKIGHLDDRGLAPGQYRALSAEEVARFKKPATPLRKPRTTLPKNRATKRKRSD
jgi:pseudouridine synthase